MQSLGCDQQQIDNTRRNLVIQQDQHVLSIGDGVVGNCSGKLQLQKIASENRICAKTFVVIQSQCLFARIASHSEYGCGFNCHNKNVLYINEHNAGSCLTINLSYSGIIALDCTYLIRVKRLLLNGTKVSFLDYQFLGSV